MIARRLPCRGAPLKRKERKESVVNQVTPYTLYDRRPKSDLLFEPITRGVVSHAVAYAQRVFLGKLRQQLLHAAHALHAAAKSS